MFPKRSTIEGYAPRTLLRRLIGGERDAGESVERHSTVMFTDITGFTKLAETLSPSATARFLTAHFRALARCIEGERGTVGKILGDGLLAYWDGGEVAAPALRSALAIRSAVTTDNRARSRAGLVPIRLRVGLHAGPLVMARLGAARSLGLTPLGDTVNVASRMETSAPAGSIQVSKRTARRLEPLYALSSCAPVALRGLGPVTTYLLEGRKPELEEDAFPRARNARSNVVELARSWSRSGEEGRAI